MCTGSQTYQYLGVSTLCHAPTGGWPHEWPQHVGGIRSVEHTFTRLCAFVVLISHPGALFSSDTVIRSIRRIN